VDEHFLPLEAQVGEDVERRFRDGLPAADMVSLTSLDTSGCSLLADRGDRAIRRCSRVMHELGLQCVKR
jgi:hypothetical protein